MEDQEAKEEAYQAEAEAKAVAAANREHDERERGRTAGGTAAAGLKGLADLLNGRLTYVIVPIKPGREVHKHVHMSTQAIRDAMAKGKVGGDSPADPKDALLEDAWRFVDKIGQSDPGRYGPFATEFRDRYAGVLGIEEFKPKIAAEQAADLADELYGTPEEQLAQTRRDRDELRERLVRHGSERSKLAKALRIERKTAQNWKESYRMAHEESGRLFSELEEATVIRKALVDQIGILQGRVERLKESFERGGRDEQTDAARFGPPMAMSDGKEEESGT